MRDKNNYNDKNDYYDDNVCYDELLQYIRNERSQRLEEARKAGMLCDYILNKHKEMMEKYPEMIAHVYTDEEWYKEGRNQ